MRADRPRALTAAPPGRAATAERAAAPGGRFGAFRYRNFALYWTGQLVANVTAWMQITATGWLVLELTNSPAFLGLNAALQAVPILAFSLVGGVIADRFDRHRLILCTQLAQILPDAALAVLVGTGQVRVEHVFLYSLVAMTINGLATPARQALVPALVPREALLSAVALNGTVWHGSAMLGPMLAGLVVAGWGLTPNFYASAAGQMVFLGTLLAIRVTLPAGRAPTSAWASVVEGMRYVCRHASVRTVLLVVAGVSLVGRSYPQIMPVFARDVYEAGPQGLGLLLTVPAVGTVVAGLGLAAVGRVPLGRAFLVMSGALGLALVAFALTPWFWLALGPLLLVGATAQVATAIAQTILQEAVDDRMRGRVLGYFMSATWGANRVGALPIGLLAAATSAPFAVALSGALLILALGPVARSRLLER